MCIIQTGQVQRKTQEMAIPDKWLWLCVILSHQSESVNRTYTAVWCFSKFYTSILFRACSSSSFLLRLENVFFTAGHTTLEHWCFKSKIFFQDCSPRRAFWPNALEGKCTLKDYFSWNLYFESWFKMTVSQKRERVNPVLPCGFELTVTFLCFTCLNPWTERHVRQFPTSSVTSRN